MPALGYGLGGVKQDVCTGLVAEAIRTGYRLIDAAVIYANEAETGVALAETDVPRDELFVTTKCWPEQFGFDAVQASCAQSLVRLQVDYFDLYLLHWPAPDRDLYVQSWRALIALQEQGKVKSIGLSNFTAEQITRLVDETGVLPALNQIECHPHHQRPAERAFHDKMGITTQCWSSIGRSRGLADPVLVRLAEKHSCSPAQLVLAWHLDAGRSPVVRSRNFARMKENFNRPTIVLDDGDRATIAALDKGLDGRLEPPPAFPA